MPTFDNPVFDADEAAEALRGLAHASRVFDQPGDTYRVIGALTAVLGSLQQSLDQVAAWHTRNLDFAADDGGDRLAGRSDAESAALSLRVAAECVREANRSLNAAHSCNGRIAWQHDIPPSLESEAPSL